MKKSSQIVVIGLLAISLAACKKHHRRHPLLNRTDSSNSSYFIGYGYGFNPFIRYGYPIYFDNETFYSGGRMITRPGYVYSGASGVGRSSFGGRSATFSRGGFGSIGSGHGSMGA